MSEVAWWRGEFGDEYTERNAGAGIDARVELWGKILRCLNGWSCIVTAKRSILEVGAGNGNNLEALRRFAYANLCAVEPNVSARRALAAGGVNAFDGTAASPGRRAELVFTSGVLIHIPPDELMAACQGIYDAAERFIVSIEYFAADPEEKLYRGHAGKLWKRDFGAYWLDNFKLEPLGCGFEWKRMTGLDNLTWWAFAK